MTWKNLLAMGISGGMVPCPAALVLLLSSIAMGNVGLGLVLVLAFSLGLAGVLTGLGLSLVYAKRLFQRLPTQIRSDSDAADSQRDRHYAHRVWHFDSRCHANAGIALRILMRNQMGFWIRIIG